MPIFPIRDISKYGVITDIDPYNLPTEAFSMGLNVRFKNNSVQRAPVFRNAFNTLSNVSPRWLATTLPTTGYDTILIGYLNGRVTSYLSGTETDVSIVGYVNANAEVSYTSCHLADVTYMNRSDRVPWGWLPGGTTMVVLSGWPANYRANLLRSAGNALVAFGVTKGAASYPSLVKTSEFAAEGTMPTNWDPTITGTNATENLLAEMDGGIVDAMNLGDGMVIYGLNETWSMLMDGSTNVWSYHRIFTDAGAINANCSVEVNRQHYVFGPTDIWKHDGNSKASISDQRVREFIFSSINQTLLNRCFVAHNAGLKEIYFCFVSADAYTSFASVDGCNRCATYNYVNDTWSFDDLPYVFGGVRASLNTIQTWTSTTATWDTVGGTWLDQEGSKKRVFVWLGDTNVAASLTASLYAFDLQGPGSLVNYSVDQTATKGWTLLRDGIDLDAVGVDLKGYKVCNSIYPQARIEPLGAPISFNVGAADYFNAPVTWDTAQTYDGDTLYKLDYNMAGRYLFIKITDSDYHYINLSGFDLDLDVLGER